MADMGFTLVATAGTAKLLTRQGLAVERIFKVADGDHPNVIDLMRGGDIALMFNTPEDGRARRDSSVIRRTAVSQSIPYSTVDGARLRSAPSRRCSRARSRSVPAGVPCHLRCLIVALDVATLAPSATRRPQGWAAWQPAALRLASRSEAAAVRSP
jgi:hypothetical protein